MGAGCKKPASEGGPNKVFFKAAAQPLTFGAVFYVAGEFFDLFGFAHEVQAQHLARVRLIHFCFQLRRQVVKLLHFFLDVFLVFFQHPLFRGGCQRIFGGGVRRGFLILRELGVLRLRQFACKLGGQSSRQQAAQECSPVLHRNSSFAACVVHRDAAPRLLQCYTRPSTNLMSSLLSYFPDASVAVFFRLVAILIVVLVVNRLLRLITNLLIKPAASEARAANAREQQTRTVAMVLYSAGSKIVWRLALLTAASGFRIDVLPAATPAGLSSLALGFAAQNPLRDCI